MNTKIIPKSHSLTQYISSISMLDHLAKKILCSQLERIKYGTIVLLDLNETMTFGLGQEIKVTIEVKRTRFYSRTMLGGSIGNAESYVDGDWDCNDLVDLVRLFVKNREVLQKIDGSMVNLLSPIQKVFHGLRSNTLEGSKENIRSHYDMGNDFFKLFLDSKMMYSCALFDSPMTSLEDASEIKLRTICHKLNLNKNDHLLEIGSGWGGLAIFAAQNYGCKVTTTTISKEQFDFANSKIKELGLEDRIEVLFEDYRELKGVYDKLVSIEMIEAVGLNNLDNYFSVCSNLLKPNGIMVLQAITIRDQFYENAKKSVDFIQRHIFPGSGIPSVTSIMSSITKKTDMVLVHQEDFAEDYAQTLRLWKNNFDKNVKEVIDLGYPHFLPRLWHFYFAYCEGGFRERAIGLSQMILAKPEYKNRSLV